jgi:hypothetical protein
VALLVVSLVNGPIVDIDLRDGIEHDFARKILNNRECGYEIVVDDSRSPSLLAEIENN